ncbi:hypothetical protein AMTRI_Chr08g166990 [Amborella trichopoda]
MYNVRSRRFSVVGIPPLGCLLLIKNALLSVDCVPFFNDLAISFNNKVKTALATPQSVGATCRGQSICGDPSKYVFFFVVHPTERMYGFIANTTVTRDLANI